MPAKKDLDVYPGDDYRWPMQIRRAEEFTGSMTALSAVLTSTTATFTAGDVGRNVLVVGAGASGEHLETTVLSYQSGTQVTLAEASGTSVVLAQMFIWRPQDLTDVNLQAEGKVSEDDVAATITFTFDKYAAAEGKFYLQLLKDQTVLVTQTLVWDLQMVDTLDNDWTTTILKGKVKMGSGKQVSITAVVP